MNVVVSSSTWLPFIIVVIVLYASYEKEDDFTPWTMVQQAVLLVTLTFATQPLPISILTFVIVCAALVFISYYLRHTEQVED